MGAIGFTEKSVTIYHSALRNIQEERRLRLHNGRRLKSRRVSDLCPFESAHTKPILCELLLRYYADRRLKLTAQQTLERD
jgi:hypothetical protein